MCLEEKNQTINSAQNPSGGSKRVWVRKNPTTDASLGKPKKLKKKGGLSYGQTVKKIPGRKKNRKGKPG